MNADLSDRKLKGQVALVTGGGTGIGAGIARALARSGAHVFVNYPFPPDRDEAVQVCREIRDAGGKADPVMADVSREQQVADMFGVVVSAAGTLHILVNNAGIQRDAPLTEMSLSQWQQVIDTNLTGQFLCAKQAAREFLRRGLQSEISCSAGKIICVSSVHQVIPWAGHVNYTASKGGLMLFMKSIAQELAPHKIRVNSVCPGAIKTNINKSVWSDPAAAQRLTHLVPYGRIGEVEDVGKAAVWLASDESEYVNGASLFIDGGMTLYPGFSTNG